MDINTTQALVSLIPVVGAAVGAVVALIKGKTTKKTKGELTVSEQKQDLNNYMVGECSNVEQFSLFLKSSMTKEQLSAYKRNTVLRNMKMYAMAQGYSWYDENVAQMELENYISNANAVSGKSVNPTTNQLGK